MELYGNKGSAASAGLQLYRALAAGDLPAARLVSKSSGDDPASAFNRGLCLFRLGETEQALTELKRAEQLLGNPPELDISERNLFIKAIELSKEQPLYLLPLDPEAAEVCARYFLIRTKWLSAVCLEQLGRSGEAALIKRFLAQYNIEI